MKTPITLITMQVDGGEQEAVLEKDDAEPKVPLITLITIAISLTSSWGPPRANYVCCVLVLSDYRVFPVWFSYSYLKISVFEMRRRCICYLICHIIFHLT